MTFLKYFFLDETVFVKVVFFYFALLSKKKKNVSNNKHLHKGSKGLDPQYRTRQSICSEETQNISHFTSNSALPWH